MEKGRIQKVLAHAGIASRREIERMIKEGRVRVNQKALKELGKEIDPSVDKVTIDGRSISFPEKSKFVYILLNKPAGYVSTTSDEKDRPTVLDLVLGFTGERVYPVGRLDYDSEGALILTNDGELTNKLLNPKRHVPKVYNVKVKGTPTEESLNMLRKGIYLEDGPTGSSEIEIIGKAKVNTWLQVTLTKGKNRQIKRMFWRIEHPVMKIERISFAGIAIGKLPIGECRNLTKPEVDSLKAA